ncbi:hypothetical protein CRV24_000962 [Beauveria bassiana]|uniref:Gp24-like protein n=1 Tax=Beauveria bassiana (strain ARSEF 2860) TaxID=655819 RepID=J4WG48_BEAB2|nr:gp24-like protein [Beauveria bassiana ARSEF 2860]EJP68905.1 gp24-like protein [Beauveria bassiana ARSEF 2860]KAF1739031.1 hypothetical protein CRV24_000962 [Beauveria bassiana]KAH8720474.1 hypothetical protein HC256_000866 [Beauveria bassiana]
MFLSFIFVTALAAKLSSATVGANWLFPDAESGSNLINDVTFPFDLSRAPQQAGFYFAQQFNFDYADDSTYSGAQQFYYDYNQPSAYIGLQPQPRNASGSVIRAAFSSFINGTTTNSSLCYYGADGGPGVSCGVEFNGDYSHKYDCVAETTDGGNTWRGTVVNTNTGAWHSIGEWTLPKKAAGIGPRGLGFAEYYSYPRDQYNTEICNALPSTEVSFFSPSSSTNRAGEGVIEKPYEYGVCEHRSAFRTWGVSEGYHVKTGFQGQGRGHWWSW